MIISWGCPAGYSGSSVADCTLCSLGKYSDMGATACTDCGGSCSSGTKRCITSGTSTCCTTGQYFVEGTSTGCQTCASGLYGDGSATTCTAACAPGGYMNNGACVNCGAGTYQPVSGATNSSQCLACGAGNYSSTAGSTVCSVCAAGTFKRAVDVICVSCAAGTYSTGVGATTVGSCNSCPLNSGKLTGATFCMANAGYYLSPTLSGSYITSSQPSYSVTSGDIMLFNNDPYNALWGLSGSVAITISGAAFTVTLPAGPSYTDSGGYPVVRDDTTGGIVSPYVWYKFDSGACLEDSSGNGFSLTSNVANPCSATGPVRGSSSFEFKQSPAQYATLPGYSLNLPTVQSASGITIAFWGKMASSTPYEGRFMDFSLVSSGGRNILDMFAIYRASGGNYVSFYLGGGIDGPPGTQADGNWHHYVWSVSSSRYWTIYYDGANVEIGSKRTPGISSSATSADYVYYFGKDAVAARYFDGNMDDFRVYMGVLSANQVSTLYQGRLGEYAVGFSQCTAPSCTSVGQVSRCAASGAGVCCPAGSYFREGVDSSCAPCPAGTYSTSGSQTACTTCPNGMYVAATGSVSSSNCTSCDGGSCATGIKRCINSASKDCCVDGQYFIEGVSTGCQTCAAGLFSLGSATSCSLMCAPGTYLLYGVCEQCGIGTYQAVTGATSVNQCLPCAVCSDNATTPGTCAGGSGADMSCQCKSGYYGNGASCTPCQACSPNATQLSACNSTANVACQCKAGTYGDGLTCTACKTCAANATQSGSSCVAGQSTDTVECTCNVGFYGDGVTCTPCRSCSTNGYMVGDCPAGTPGDTRTCACNATYYGDGFTCTPCKTCHLNASITATCNEGSTADVKVCTCNAGFTGTGVACTPCAAGSAFASSTVTGG